MSVVDGTVTSGVVTGGTGVTLASVVVDAGHNAMLVAVKVPSAGFTTDITVMSWNGVSFARLTALDDTNTNSIDTWIGVGLTPGTASLTFSSAHGFAFDLACISLGGVDSVTPTGATSTVQSTTNLNNAAVATTVGGYVVGCGIAEASSALTAQNGQTQLFDSLFAGTVTLHVGKQTAGGTSTQDRYTVTAFGVLVSFQINASAAPLSSGWLDFSSVKQRRLPFTPRGVLLTLWQGYNFAPQISTTPVASSDGLVQDEALQGIDNTGQVVQEEALGSVVSAQAVQEEALAALALAQAVIEEAIAGIDNGGQLAWYESTFTAALGDITVPDPSPWLQMAWTRVRQRFDFTPTITFSVASSDGLVQDEALQGIDNGGQTVQEEAVAALASVSVAITEALSALSASSTVSEEALQGVTTTTTVAISVAQKILASLAVVLESITVTPNGVPMAGINSIVFAAMVTLAALDSLTTTSAFDG